MGDVLKQVEGILREGTLSEKIRNRVKNPDGSVSTVRTMSFNEGKGEVVIPTVVKGKVLSDKEAIKHYRGTGERFPIFDTVTHAVKYSKKLHDAHEAELRKGK